MSRIEKMLSALDRPALVTFIMASDPDLVTSQEMLNGLPEAGADIIELGMPFTDPAADGPTIQAAGLRALEAGGDMKRTLQMVRDFRKGNDSTPIVLMGYFNPLMAYGVEAFCKDAAEAGVDGLIIVDLPPEESDVLQSHAKPAGLDFVRLITPTSTGQRLDMLTSEASGFLYYVSITGVTGAASANLDALKPHIAEIKSKTDLPVAIGFGIKTPEDAAQMGAIGDAVVVGSSIIETLQAQGVSAALEKVRDLRAAL